MWSHQKSISLVLGKWKEGSSKGKDKNLNVWLYSRKIIKAKVLIQKRQKF